MGSRINLTHHCFLEPATDVWDSTFLSCLFLFISFYLLCAGLPISVLLFEGILTCWCFVLRALIEAFVEQHHHQQQSTVPLTKECLGHTFWRQNVRRFGWCTNVAWDQGLGRDEMSGKGVMAYVNKKIFQGLGQMVFIAILLASTGIPMHTSWCNLARNTSYCTRRAYLILDSNIGKRPYVGVRY